MFFSRKNNNLYPFQPQFYYIKLGFKWVGGGGGGAGVNNIKACFRDEITAFFKDAP